MVGTPVSKSTYNTSTTCFGLYFILLLVVVGSMVFDWAIVGGTCIILSQFAAVIAYLLLINGIKHKRR